MITLDGNTLASFGLIAQPGHEHGIPQTVDRIVSIPNRNGAYDFGSDIGPREFSIPLALATETSRMSLQSKIRTFTSFLMNAQGKPREITLVFDYEPDKYYTVRYSGNMPIERLFSMGFLVLPLIAFDQFARATVTAFDEVYEYDDGHEYDTDLIYPNPESFNWIYDSHMSSAYNYSKMSTPLIVSIAGAVTNPVITNLNTGESLTITKVILSDEELVIKGAPYYSVTIDGVNALQYVTGDFPDLLLQEGANGLVFEGTSPNAIVTYEWEHKFI